LLPNGHYERFFTNKGHEARTDLVLDSVVLIGHLQKWFFLKAISTQILIKSSNEILSDHTKLRGAKINIFGTNKEYLIKI